MHSFGSSSALGASGGSANQNSNPNITSSSSSSTAANSAQRPHQQQHPHPHHQAQTTRQQHQNQPQGQNQQGQQSQQNQQQPQQASAAAAGGGGLGGGRSHQEDIIGRLDAVFRQLNLIQHQQQQFNQQLQQQLHLENHNQSGGGGGSSAVAAAVAGGARYRRYTGPFAGNSNSTRGAAHFSHEGEEGQQKQEDGDGTEPPASPLAGAGAASSPSPAANQQQQHQHSPSHPHGGHAHRLLARRRLTGAAGGGASHPSPTRSASVISGGGGGGEGHGSWGRARRSLMAKSLWEQQQQQHHANATARSKSLSSLSRDGSFAGADAAAATSINIDGERGEENNFAEQVNNSHDNLQRDRNGQGDEVQNNFSFSSNHNNNENIEDDGSGGGGAGGGRAGSGATENRPKQRQVVRTLEAETNVVASTISSWWSSCFCCCCDDSDIIDPESGLGVVLDVSYVLNTFCIFIITLSFLVLPTPTPQQVLLANLDTSGDNSAAATPNFYAAAAIVGVCQLLTIVWVISRFFVSSKGRSDESPLFGGGDADEAAPDFEFEIIDTPELIRAKFLKFWFWYDLLYAVPIEFVFIFNEDWFFFVTVRHLLRIYRLRYVGSSANPLNPRRSSIVLTAYACGVVTITHLIACVFVQFETNAGQNNKTADIGIVTGLYWATATLTSVGFGDIEVATQSTRILAIFACIAGIFVVALSAAIATRALTQTDLLEEEQRRQKQMMSSMLRHFQIPWPLQKEIIVLMPSILKSQTEMAFRDMIRVLPPFLSEQVDSYLRASMLSKVPIFAGLEDAIILRLAKGLQQCFAAPTEYVINAGEAGAEMYLLVHGVVEVLVPINAEEEFPVATLRSGSYFGEIALIEETVRTASVQCVTACDLLVLDKELFLEVVQQEEVLQQRIQGEIAKRQEEMKAKRRQSVAHNAVKKEREEEGEEENEEHDDHNNENAAAVTNVSPLPKAAAPLEGARGADAVAAAANEIVMEHRNSNGNNNSPGIVRHRRAPPAVIADNDLIEPQQQQGGDNENPGADDAHAVVEENQDEEELHGNPAIDVLASSINHIGSSTPSATMTTNPLSANAAAVRGGGGETDVSSPTPRRSPFRQRHATDGDLHPHSNNNLSLSDARAAASGGAAAAAGGVTRVPRSPSFMFGGGAGGGSRSFGFGSATARGTGDE